MRFWHRRHLPLLASSTDPVVLEVGGYVSECLDSGAVLTTERRELLGARLSELEHDPRSRDLLPVIRHVEVATGLR
ncbi:hypothetical protein ACFYY8_03795 [Streptosporangium sp. NPDC001559]|uniref:hypothetical protein n=1 Tax=Streptosporangium sp. NPDC001559 TaxID=3366187 RepID=UPI0036ECF419